MLATAFFVILLLQTCSDSVKCESFEHTYDREIHMSPNSLLYEGNIFDKLSTEPKNYTIAYMYEGNPLKGFPEFIKVNVDGVKNSSATIELGADSHRESVYVKVLINVTNATDFASSIKIFGFSALKNSINNNILNLMTRGRTQASERMAVCNNKPVMSVQDNAKIGGIMKIGKRKPGDFLLHLQKVLVEPGYLKFPRHHFEFSDDNVSISEVTITASTRHITFNNEIWKSQTLFWATLHGLEKNNGFWALLTIYGTKFQ